MVPRTTVGITTVESTRCVLKFARGVLRISYVTGAFVALRKRFFSVTKFRAVIRYGGGLRFSGQTFLADAGPQPRSWTCLSIAVI